MLKDAVLVHGGKNWEAIAALVPNRTKKQCQKRWHDTLISNTEPTTARVCKWTADEDKMLWDVVLTRGAKSWEAIAALVPGRTISQCYYRWTKYVDPNCSTFTDHAETTTGETVEPQSRVADPTTSREKVFRNGKLHTGTRLMPSSRVDFMYNIIQLQMGHSPGSSPLEKQTDENNLNLYPKLERHNATNTGTTYHSSYLVFKIVSSLQSTTT
jgi:hypothetical protein